MEAVVEGRADYAVLPIENTTAGIVADIYDLLTEYELSIVGEQIIRPEHVLLGLPDAELEDIRQVCSHPQALSQCGKYLESHPDWKKKEMENTAGSAKKIKEDNDKTQQQIADMLNMHRSVYRRYESGEREIPVWAVIKLADYYRVSTDYLLGLTDDPARR